MNKKQILEIVSTMNESCSSETKHRFGKVIDHLRAMDDEELYPVVLTIVAYAFKRNTRLMGNLLLLGHKLIEESVKSEHQLVVEDFYAKFNKLFEKETVQ